VSFDYCMNLYNFHQDKNMDHFHHTQNSEVTVPISIIVGEFCTYLICKCNHIICGLLYQKVAFEVHLCIQHTERERGFSKYPWK
jgi:hypothetical protein